MEAIARILAERPDLWLLWKQMWEGCRHQPPPAWVVEQFTGVAPPLSAGMLSLHLMNTLYPSPMMRQSPRPHPVRHPGCVSVREGMNRMHAAALSAHLPSD